MNPNFYKIGIDVGSTTLKMVVLDGNNEVVHCVYRRHQAAVHSLFIEEVRAVYKKFPDSKFHIGITGAAGLGLAQRLSIPFVQEVVAAVEMAKRYYPHAHTLLDIGGEDSKMVFLEEGKQPDMRMNGRCAGGTGAFIDQMADLLHISVEELGRQALLFKKIYPVASRCGVFAKTDVQSLIAHHTALPDVAMSILHAVALQIITSLARGRTLLPPILCIGGPLTFLSGLRLCLQNILQISEYDLMVPENSALFSAWGVAWLSAQNNLMDGEDLRKLREVTRFSHHIIREPLPPLFRDQNEYAAWRENRNIKILPFAPLSYEEKQKEMPLFLGIDSGSTTTKIVVINEQKEIVYSFYKNNEGNPLKTAAEGIQGIRLNFASSAATGYGEHLVKSALGLEWGLVETMAHLLGAQYVDPNVSFVLDIGGQDIKSIFVHQGVISKVEVNEACSSGCGSFLQNFASTMKAPLAQFSQEACLAPFPCDLGTRCTVFMNSKVKQSLNENASLGDIAAGLAYSVVKNCLFKVLKITNLNQLGDHIVAHGGAFRNDAVYRALELLSQKKVRSTNHPEMMGALGAALYAQKRFKQKHK